MTTDLQNGQSDMLSRDTALRLGRISAISAVPLFALALLAPIPFLCAGSCGGAIVSLIAVAAAVTSLRRGGTLTHDPHSAASIRHRKPLLAVSLLLLVATVWTCMAALGTARNMSKASVSASNLRTFATVLHQYAEAHRSVPTTLTEMIELGELHPGLLLSVGDPARPSFREQAETAKYSSYVYTPPVDPMDRSPDLILAYEYCPMHPLSGHIFPELGRQVLFGDGNVRLVSEAEFIELQKIDAEHRSKTVATTRPA